MTVLLNPTIQIYTIHRIQIYWQKGIDSHWGKVYSYLHFWLFHGSIMTQNGEYELQYTWLQISYLFNRYDIWSQVYCNSYFPWFYCSVKDRTMPETCENRLGLVNNCIYHACQTPEICKVLPYSMDFKVPQELWSSWNKTVLSKCSLIWNEGPVNIWNDHKAQK